MVNQDNLMICCIFFSAQKKAYNFLEGDTLRQILGGPRATAPLAPYKDQHWAYE